MLEMSGVGRFLSNNQVQVSDSPCVSMWLHRSSLRHTRSANVGGTVHRLGSRLRPLVLRQAPLVRVKGGGDVWKALNPTAKSSIC